MGQLIFLALKCADPRHHHTAIIFPAASEDAQQGHWEALWRLATLALYSAFTHGPPGPPHTLSI